MLIALIALAFFVASLVLLLEQALNATASTAAAATAAAHMPRRQVL
jgi:hypothetical protein